MNRIMNAIQVAVYSAAVIVILLDLFVWRPN